MLLLKIWGPPLPWKGGITTYTYFTKKETETLWTKLIDRREGSKHITPAFISAGPPSTDITQQSARGPDSSDQPWEPCQLPSVETRGRGQGPGSAQLWMSRAQAGPQHYLHNHTAHQITFSLRTSGLPFEMQIRRKPGALLPSQLLQHQRPGAPTQRQPDLTEFSHQTTETSQGTSPNVL